LDGSRTPPLRQIRDVTCSDGLLRFIEIEYPDLDDDKPHSVKVDGHHVRQGDLRGELGPVLHRGLG
jgi:hypothetical protein